MACNGKGGSGVESYTQILKEMLEQMPHGGLTDGRGKVVYRLTKKDIERKMHHTRRCLIK